MPTIYAVASAKGGVGKTTTAANLAATLAAADFDTVAVDGDIGTPNLGATLGVEVPEDGGTLHDVLAGEAEPLEATYRGPHGLAVMPGDRSLSAFRSADPSRITDVLESITNADYIILDTGAGLTHESALPLSLADRVLLVSTPTRDALVDTSKTTELAKRLGGEVDGVALTRVGPEDDLQSALAAGDLDPADFDVPAVGRIPEDPTVPEAITAGEPLSAYAPSSDAAAAYRSLASSLTGEPIRPALSEEAGAAEPEPEASEAEADLAEPDEQTDDVEGDVESDDEAVESETDEVEREVEKGVEADEVETETETVEAEVAEEAEEVDEGEEDEADVPEGTAEEAEAEDAADPETDDGVIIEDSATDDEDEATTTARRTVLGEQMDEVSDGDTPITVSDAESGEEVEIEDDAIPFAEQGQERAEQAKEGQSEEEEDDGSSGGILSRLFR